MADKPFSYQLSLEDRLEQLVNNEYTSDVFFKVGDDSGQLMFAHKVIITTASEVLYAQLNGQFDEALKTSRANPIVVKDIKPPIFLEILRFMYCEKVNLTEGNLVEVYYASQKYLLSQLIETCEEFIHDEITEDNVLKIFNDNRRYEFANINEVCMNVICDNPLECFEHELFPALEKSSLKLILESTKINCHEEHLAEAAQKWLKFNASRQSLDLNDVPANANRTGRELLCHKLYAFSGFRYSDSVITDITVDVFKTFNLYGFGIFVGTRIPEITSVKLKVEIKEKIRDTFEDCFSEVKIVPVKDELYIHEMLFKKITLERGIKYRIVVRMEANDQPLQDMFHLDFFEPASSTWKKIMMLTYTSQIRMNCLSYILYNEE